ncbi:hypothetical protein DMN77_05390 [Paenibacillus sp. 79R4]|uniref:hypothetical protein n=1 Tax=Paenibacillus sp. 79R4 TaxID=2212847 RepID=UPI0015BAE337|nr:hypothetical protein [Paenibacillus sp. 79R4]NWL87031.1 hypothetical protein [Paenibacillus sp. 79R4]
MAKGITLQELDSTATSRLVIKDSAGRAKVTAPSAADDIAVKSTVDNAIGNLSTLQTTDKSNVVKAINELFTNVNKGKELIVGAIIDKKGTASPNDTFPTLAENIRQIKTGIEDAMQDMSDWIQLILDYIEKSEKYVDINATLDKNKNVLFKIDSKACIVNKNMIPLYTSLVDFSYAKIVLTPNGKHFFAVFGDVIEKYTTSGVLVWKAAKTATTNIWDDVSTNDDILAVLSKESRDNSNSYQHQIRLYDAKNGALLTTTLLSTSSQYSMSAAWDERKNVFLAIDDYGNASSNAYTSFVRTDGAIQKESRATSKDWNYLRYNLYKFIYCLKFRTNEF